MEQFRIMCKIDKHYGNIRRNFFIEIKKLFFWSDIYTSNGYIQNTKNFDTYEDAENYIINDLAINHAIYKNGNVYKIYPYSFGY